MEYNANDEWVVDLDQMTCVSRTNKIVLKFVEEGEAVVGKIRKMPCELVTELAKELAGKTDGRKRLKEAILEAEEAFLHAYFESKAAAGNGVINLY